MLLHGRISRCKRPLYRGGWPTEWKAVRLVQEKARQTLGMEILPAQALHILIECGTKAYFGKEAKE